MSVCTIDEIKNVVSEVAKQYGVKKVALFGSYSKNAQTSDSDIDLIIDKGELKGLFMFNSFVYSLEERLSKDVDVITYASLNNSLLAHTVTDEVILYEQ